MTNALQPLESFDAPPALAEKIEGARKYLAKALSENTLRAYRADLRCFKRWCDAHQVEPLPADSPTVIAYISDMADNGYSASTIQRRLTTIRKVHRAAKLDDPTDAEHVTATWKGIRNSDHVKVAQEGKAPIMTPHIVKMLATLDDKAKGLRDRALILLGFAGGFRRSELVALDVDDLSFTHEGVIVRLRKSKTNQEGRLEEKTLHRASDATLCPVRAVKTWMRHASIQSGAIFRGVDRHGNISENRLSGRGVARAVKGAAANAGFDAEQVGAHSLRAGFVTQMKANGATDEQVTHVTGQSASTMRRYDRGAKRFRHNTTEALGL